MAGCASGKVRFHDQQAAGMALVNAKIRRVLRHNQKRREVRAYECPTCRGWHLTSKP